MRTAASTTTRSPPGPAPTANCWASRWTPPSIAARIPPTRSAPAWRRRRLAPSSPAPTCCRCSAAAPCPPAPTSLPSCHIAAWPGPACATPWKRRSTRWPRKLGLAAAAIRLANLPPPEAMPYRQTSSARCSTAGDYPEALRRAAAAIGIDAVRARQAAGECVGVGLAVFCEQGGARHLRLSWLGHPVRPRLRTGLRALLPGRRAGAAGGGAQPRPRGWRPPWRRWRTRCWAFTQTGSA